MKIEPGINSLLKLWDLLSNENRTGINRSLREIYNIMGMDHSPATYFKALR
jgi:hypothetical protein